MIHLVDANDKLQVIISAAVTVDTVCSFSDLSGTTVTPGKELFARTTAATHDLVSAPGASTVRRVHTIFIRNKHATTPVDVTAVFDDNGTDYEIHKATLLAGEMLEYVEGLGWFTIQTTRKEAYNRRVTGDYTNSTTSFTDITGLTCPVTSGKHYAFEAHLYHFSAAATTGPRFAIGGVAMTAMRIQAIITEVGSVAAGVMNTNIADVTAVDTAVQATTDAQVTTPVMSIMSGWFNPSASGTFAVRGASEVGASAVTVKIGSWVQIWETDN